MMLPAGQPNIQPSNIHVRFANAAPYAISHAPAYNGPLVYWRGANHAVDPRTIRIPHIVNRFHTPVYATTNNYCQNPLIQRFNVSPLSGRHGCFTIWNNVRPVPLSFDAHPNNDESATESDDSLYSKSDDENDLWDSEEKSSLLHAQNDVVNSALNPGNRKRNIVSSWFTESRFRVKDVEKYQSAVLIPSYRRSKSHKIHRPTREERFAARHPHLVEMFGRAYVRWRQARVTEKDTTLEKQLPLYKRVNYSKLYNESFPSHVMCESRKEGQIAEAVESISL